MNRKSTISPMTKATAMARKSVEEKGKAVCWVSLMKVRVAAPKMAGIESRNENLAASVLLKPRRRAAMRVLPKRLTPGTKAIHWITPIMRESFRVSESKRRVVGIL